MFWTSSVLLTVLWLMGVVTGYTIDGAIHVLPVAAVLMAILGGLRRNRRHEARLGGHTGRGAF